MLNFGAGKLIATPTADASGAAVANPTPVLLGAMQDISVDISVDLKMLYGNKRFPLAAGHGKGKIELKAKYADISGGVLGSLFFGQTPTAGIKGVVSDSPATIPANPGPYTLDPTPPNSGTFVADLGIFDASTGKQFARVASSPETGQYSVEADGTYTFAAADAGKAILMSYEYSASSTSGQIFTITNQLMGYTPSFSVLLHSKYEGKNLVVKFNKAVSDKLALPLKNEDFTISDFSAQAMADAADSVGYICLF